MKRFWLTITIVISFAALAIPRAEGYMSRGVYVNSEVHYLSVGADAQHQTVSHQAGTVDSNSFLSLGTAVTQNVSSCTPDIGGVGMNGAVFDNKIFFAFTGNPGCPTPNATTGLPSATHLYVIAWDLEIGDFAKNTNGVYTGPTDLGAVHHFDSQTPANHYHNQVWDMASAAIVVFNNLLYVFSDSGTYTSGDGVNWSSYPALVPSSNDLQPLDAITFYPPDTDPLMMIIYGNFTTPYYMSNEYISLLRHKLERPVWSDLRCQRPVYRTRRNQRKHILQPIRGPVRRDRLPCICSAAR
jgi:hypothetical protein